MLACKLGTKAVASAAKATECCALSAVGASAAYISSHQSIETSQQLVIGSEELAGEGLHKSGFNSQSETEKSLAGSQNRSACELGLTPLLPSEQQGQPVQPKRPLALHLQPAVLQTAHETHSKRSEFSFQLYLSGSAARGRGWGSGAASCLENM